MFNSVVELTGLYYGIILLEIVFHVSVRCEENLLHNQVRLVDIEFVLRHKCLLRRGTQLPFFLVQSQPGLQA